MSYITTYTGKHFDPVNPDASLLCIEDIAHALSLLCRGNGHVQTFFSVGQHCIACAKEAQAPTARAGYLSVAVYRRWPLGQPGHTAPCRRGGRAGRRRLQAHRA